MAKDIKLPRLRDLVKEHPAFEVTSKLEQLAKEYEALVIWCPKYHCELKPIEGFWCYLKGYVRRNNDQNFQNLLPLFSLSIEKYKESRINGKLCHRFWKCIEMYDSGATYQEVLQSLFGAKSSSNVKTHKKLSIITLL